jgi:hypothetical protein
MLLPFAVYAVWSYVENRHLDSALKAISESGEALDLQAVHLTPDESRAERYYRAAAALGTAFREEQQGWSGAVAAADRDGAWSPELIAQTRGVVANVADALDYLDRAAALPFRDFLPGYQYNGLASSLTNPAHAAMLRSVVRASDGAGDAAADSLYSAVRAFRWSDTQNGGPVGFYDVWVVPSLRTVLERSVPSDDALRRLDEALVVADRDDVLRETFIGLRRRLLASHPANPFYLMPARGIVIDRPWAMHDFSEGLDWLSKVIAASQGPWPQRMDNVAALGFFPSVFGGTIRPPVPPAQVAGSVANRVRPLAAVRVARVLIAVERYRRQHAGELPAGIEDIAPRFLANVPVDPFSGRPLLYSREPGRYRVYSVGENRTDDGGNFTPQWQASGGHLSPDIGIEVRAATK